MSRRCVDCRRRDEIGRRRRIYHGRWRYEKLRRSRRQGRYRWIRIQQRHRTVNRADFYVGRVDIISSASHSSACLCCHFKVESIHYIEGRFKLDGIGSKVILLFNPNRLPSLLLLLVAAGKEAGAGEAKAGVSGTGGKDWKLASLGGGAKAAASSSLSLAVSTHWPFFGSHTIYISQGKRTSTSRQRRSSTFRC